MADSSRLDVGVTLDALGPELVELVHDPDTGMRGVIVVDNSVLGPTGGGTRMAPDLTVAEVAKLARAMTYKFGIFGFPRGGSKAGIWGNPALPADEKRRVLRAFGAKARHLIASKHAAPGPDMGISVDDVAEIYAGAETPQLRSGLFARPYDGDPAAYSITGYGVVRAAELALEMLGRSFRGARVAVEGLGQVGTGCVRFAHRKGAKVVAVSTVAGALIDEAGIDVERLLALRREHGDACIAHYAKAATSASNAAIFPVAPNPDRAPEKSVSLTASTSLATLDVDVYIPAAREEAITLANVREIRAKLVASGGNNSVSDDAMALLHERGVYCLPDFVTNAGAAIASWIDFFSGNLEQAFAAVESSMTRVVPAIVAESIAKNAPPTPIARAIVERRIAEARGLPRKSFEQASSEIRVLVGM